MLSNKGAIISVSGPTCTGKSALAVDLASAFNGEIVNCDSMQVYLHFDIGTAKPEPSVLNRIPHHLIDIVEPHEEFNAARFQQAADKAIADIRKRGKTPILVGGTGLYLKALLYGLFEAGKDESLRMRLQTEYADDPVGLYEQLKEIDPGYAAKISFKDKTRVVRAIEVFRVSGKKVSELAKDHGFREPRYGMLKIGLERERKELYGRIDARVDDMFARGWIEEVVNILGIGIEPTVKPFSSIGYKEILLYLNDRIPYGDMVKDIRQKTRHYAKRQFTWFAKEGGVEWFRFPEDSQTISRRVIDFLEQWS